MTDIKDTARYLASYVKHYGAGAFGAPMASELAGGNLGVYDEGSGEKRVAFVSRRLTRASVRQDFIGQPYTVPAGASIITHIAAGSEAVLPDLSAFDLIYAHVEDHNLIQGLIAQGRSVHSVRVSSTAQLIGCYGHGAAPRLYSDADRATFVRMDLPELPLGEALEDLVRVTGWHDDFPYYSDGTWSAISIRGYKPDDPQWGVKPSEMPRNWIKEHPEAVDLRCDWTTAAEVTPALRSYVESLPGIGALERVRLFRMAAHPKGNGRLGRHSDIQDAAVGTRDGDLMRIHVPIRTHPDITMTCWDLSGIPHTAHLKAGSAYYLDTRKPHCVSNPSPVDRVHLVIDTEVTPALRRLIVEGEPQ